jgi:hypothetical protein
LVALLVLEGLMVLSERFRWFGFNEARGFTVRITIFLVGLALLAMLLWLAVSLVFRLRFQFTIRSLLLLTLVVAVPCSWLTTENQRVDIVVTDSDGKPIEGATLWFQSLNTTGGTTATNAKGEAVISWNWEPYDCVSVSKPGFRSVEWMKLDQQTPIPVVLGR